MHKEEFVSFFHTATQIAGDVRLLFAHQVGKYTNQKNPTGDTQLNLDVMGHDILVRHFSKLPDVWGLISEEAEDIILTGKKGKYLVAFDPLDGSSVASSGLAVGTSIGIYEQSPHDGVYSAKNLVAAFAIIYGSAVYITISYGEGTDIYKLNEFGEFILNKKSVQLGREQKLIMPGGMHKNVPGYTKFVEDFLKNGGKMRYAGSLAVDVHHILHGGGGIFLYPTEKMRLLYEAAPMAFLVTQAGGCARGGDLDILEMETAQMHQEVPLVLGTQEFVDQYYSFS